MGLGAETDRTTLALVFLPLEQIARSGIASCYLDVVHA
jgi:hypothetical protein